MDAQQQYLVYIRGRYLPGKPVDVNSMIERMLNPDENSRASIDDIVSVNFL